MGIRMAGIDHSIAPIDIRTVFSFTKKSTAEALEKLKQVKGVEGCVLLSTCNRMELYLSVGEDFESDIFELLCELRALPEYLFCDYRPYFRFRQEREAVHHLFRLAGGLESRILGDDQIVTQVKDALTFAREHYAADHVLETLFRQAVTAAKKVKTGGMVSSADQSVVHTAIRTLKEQGYEFEGRKCMVIGNGVMGKLAVTQLQEQGADVTVTVRQYRSGIVEIPKNCSRIDYGRRMELFGDCDYVLSATVSPNYTLTKDLVADVRKVSAAKPVVLIDLAAPRDIEPGVAELNGVCLYDIDCFREEAVSEAQKKAIAEAEECFQEQMDEFFNWYECVDVIPRIQTIKKLAAADLENRLTKKLRTLPMEKQEKEILRDDIEAAAERAMNKLLFGLRGSVSESVFRECVEGLEKVYGKQ
ncbi:MAG: glutamyl-tRNA reductase [Lachnospiraceae bacterium]|nr:glutamyl-tRNA reductase [Lachnospiraceae bacterium]